MTANPNHITAGTIAKLIANKELSFHRPQTSTTNLDATIAMLREVVAKSHGRKMPLGIDAMTKKLDLAAACLQVAVVEASRAAGEESKRKQRRVEMKAAARSLVQIRDGARFGFVAHGIGTARLDALDLRGSAHTLRERGTVLKSILEDDREELAGLPVDEWLHGVDAAMTVLASDVAAPAHAPSTQAHGASEALVLEVIESLRVGCWNAPDVLPTLRLRSGGARKRAPVVAPRPNPPAVTT